MRKLCSIILIFIFLANLSIFAVDINDNIDTVTDTAVDVEISDDTDILTEDENEEVDEGEIYSRQLEEEIKNKVTIEEKVVVGRKGYFEIGTYNMNDDISKKTRNNYKRFELKRDDKVIITHTGTNYNGSLKIEIKRKGYRDEVLTFDISEENMPIYALKEFR